MTETSPVESPVLPLHMQRVGFDPVEELGRLRDAEGVRVVETGLGSPAYLVTRYGDVRELLSDAARFSNVNPQGFAQPDGPQLSPEEQAQMRAGQLLAMDPPDHTRIRHMLAPEFTVRRIARLEARVEQIVEQHLDALDRAGPPADLVAGFALPIPSLVICELLGVPYEDRAEFQQRSRRLLDMSSSMEDRIALARESREYMSRLVARAKADPRDDILGRLVRQHGDELSDDELTGIAILLLIAGHETTANMLGIGTLALLRHPDQLALVRDDPSLAEGAVEELMRWLSIVHSGFPRTTTTEVEICGQTIPAGSIVVFALPAANRDESLGRDPELLDVTRGAPGHLAFGHGVHHCLGAPLARMEMRIAFPALLRRFPRLALAVPYEEVSFRSNYFIYGLNSLPVSW